MIIEDILLKINCKIKLFFIRRFYKNIEMGSGINLRKNVLFRANKGKIKIGKDCFFNNYCSINSMDEIIIGDNCIFGEGVKIYDHNHIYGKDIITSKSGYTVGKITIKNNVWIGSNVIILKGVNIGSNVVIGANCLIYKDIEDDSIVLNDNKISIRKIKK